MPRSPRLPLFALLLLVAPALGAVRCAAPLAPLGSTSPSAGQTAPRSVWPVVEFDAEAIPQTAVHRVKLACEHATVPTRRYVFDHVKVVIQPESDLPPGAACHIKVQTELGWELVPFETAAAGAPFLTIHDRRDPDQPLPFPDDYFQVPEPGNVTGFALDVTLPNADGSAGTLIASLAARAQNRSDGYSPIGPIAVELSEAPDTATLPADRNEAIAPLSTVALIDMTPGSESFGERISFQLTPRSDTFSPEPVSHDLVLFPGIPLEPEGSYGLVVTDRVLDGGGEPLAGSAFHQAAAGPPAPGEDAEIAKARPLTEEVLAAAEALWPVPIPRADVALAVRFSIRSTDHFVNDLLLMRGDVQATPPNVQIDDVVPDFDADVAAIVTGTFDAPVWTTSGPFLDRGPPNRRPIAGGVEAIPFILALPPEAASSGHAPLIMYQHGNPGSAEGEVPGSARFRFGREGFAVAGFTDPPNRIFVDEVAQTFGIFAIVLLNGRPPDFWVQTYAEQMAFFQALKSMATLDVLPIGAPDGIPDLDTRRIVYEGISQGSNHAQAFVAYEPELVAAGLVVGAMRFIEILEYQDRTLPLGGQPLIRDVLPANLSGLRAPDLWMAFQFFAMLFDPQDPHNHARFIYREPVEVDGTFRKASVLVLEGIDDSFIPNNASRSLAYQLGRIPQLVPALQTVAELPQWLGPIQANVDAETTAAFVQYAPLGAGVPPTPGCGSEGHFCAQGAPDAVAQRALFYTSALTGAPIVD